MLDARAIAIADDYWAAHFACARARLFSVPFQVVPHGEKLADYHGVFGLFRNGSAIVSVPGDQAATLCPLLARLARGCEPPDLASVLGSVARLIVGPACVCYANAIKQPEAAMPVRDLRDDDAEALAELASSGDDTGWEHGGSRKEHVCSGVFAADGSLTAVAGHILWGPAIADISVFTHPKFRSRGWGKSAVAHNCRRAMAAGLLPQYRTLDSNRPSIKLAEALGFERYATTMAVRLQ
jgi:GNAT superfamily N-acetyltransferase